MQILSELITSGLMQGLVLALVALGVMIPFKLLNFPDLTSEGSYPLGAAIYAAAISAQFNPFIASMIALTFGGIAGIITARIHLSLKINTLLAGIIVSTMLYSINLRFMGKPNIALFEYKTIFSDIGNLVGGDVSSYLKIAVLAIINILIIVYLVAFLYTELGLKFRAVGLNPSFAQKNGVNTKKYIFLGLFIANAFISLAGALMVQMQSYADIGMGVGIVVHALAALMIGEVIVGDQNIIRLAIAPFCGALVYSQIQGFALSVGLAPSDMKLFTGAIVLAVLMIRKKI